MPPFDLSHPEHNTRDPLFSALASKKWKKNKLIGSKEKAVNTPIVKIGATMYDGGMNKSGEDVNRKTYTSNLDKDSPKN